MSPSAEQSRSRSSHTLWEFIDPEEVQSIREELEENPLLNVKQTAALFKDHFGISRSTFDRRGIKKHLPFAYYLRQTPQVKKAQVLAVIEWLKEHPRYFEGEQPEDQPWHVNSR